ncbi:hypothetical protein HDK77DRAFT_298166 [Phyllosticta capitalensis]
MVSMLVGCCKVQSAVHLQIFILFQLVGVWLRSSSHMARQGRARHKREKDEERIRSLIYGAVWQTLLCGGLFSLVAVWPSALRLQSLPSSRPPLMPADGIGRRLSINAACLCS